MPLKRRSVLSSSSKRTSDATPRKDRRASLVHSARHLATPGQLRESLLLGAPPSLRNTCVAGMQAALAVLLALATAHLSPWPHLVGFPALGALAALFGRYASIRHRRKIVFICGVLLTIGVMLPSLASFAGAPPVLMVVLLAVGAGGYTFATSYWKLGGPGAVIFVFAVGAVLGPVDSFGVVVERSLGAAWGAVLAWLVCSCTDFLRTEKVNVAGSPKPQATPLRSEWIAAARITLGAALAALIAHFAGWHYPAWAAIGATAVMQGGHLHITMNRSLQRMAGTVLGACIAWTILVQDPSFWTMVAAIVVFQFITEVIIGYNYALGQISVTPMALLMTHLAAPVSYGNMPVERVLDTIVGAALGIVLAVLFSSADDRAYLDRRRSKLQARRKANR